MNKPAEMERLNLWETLRSEIAMSDRYSVPRRRPLLGAFLILLWLALGLTTAVLLATWTHLPGPQNIFIGFGLSSPLGIVGHRLRARDARKMLQADRRLPVLYLRPFKDDRNSGGEFPFMPQRTEEFLASRLLQQIGPVIAVHNPGDQLSRVGALRIIHRGGEWEQLVYQLMDCAELVALRLGVSNGIQIEIKQAIARVDPSRLVAMVPKSHKGTKKENHSVWHTFAKEVGWSEREIEIVSGTDTLFVRFGSDWSPVISKLPPVWLRLILSSAKCRSGLMPHFPRASIHGAVHRERP